MGTWGEHGAPLVPGQLLQLTADPVSCWLESVRAQQLDGVVFRHIVLPQGSQGIWSDRRAFIQCGIEFL